MEIFSLKSPCGSNGGCSKGDTTPYHQLGVVRSLTYPQTECAALLRNSYCRGSRRQIFVNKHGAKRCTILTPLQSFHPLTSFRNLVHFSDLWVDVYITFETRCGMFPDCFETFPLVEINERLRSVEKIFQD